MGEAVFPEGDFAKTGRVKRTPVKRGDLVLGQLEEGVVTASADLDRSFGSPRPQAEL